MSDYLSTCVLYPQPTSEHMRCFWKMVGARFAARYCLSETYSVDDAGRNYDRTIVIAPALIGTGLTQAWFAQRGYKTQCVWIDIAEPWRLWEKLHNEGIPELGYKALQDREA